MNSCETIVKTQNLSKIYNLTAEKIYAVDNVDLEIHKGDFVSIMGPSGSGKTTLLDIIGCLDGPSTGKLEILGNNVTGLKESKLVKIRRGNIGFVFQDFSLVPTLTAIENVKLALYYAGKKDKNSKAAKMLERVGMEKRINHLPKQMSGGEKQRIAIARALVIEPAFLLADEPTGQLDSENSNMIVELMKKLNLQGLTIIIATHDQNISSKTKKIIKLKDGKIVPE
jgi:putative ABC transport system ATP-binding protein